MYALLLALVLAQSDASPSESPTPPPASVPSAAATVLPLPPTDAMLSPHPRPDAPGDAVIVNSGSTNEYGYRIVVHADATADVMLGPTTNHVTLPEADARSLFEQLKSTAHLATLGSGSCMKSASFGSRETIAYGGFTSPDLSCPVDESGNAIRSAIARIRSDLHIPDVRPRHVKRYPL